MKTTNTVVLVRGAETVSFFITKGSKMARRETQATAAEAVTLNAARREMMRLTSSGWQVRNAI